MYFTGKVCKSAMQIATALEGGGGVWKWPGFAQLIRAPEWESYTYKYRELSALRTCISAGVAWLAFA